MSQPVHADDQGFPNLGTPIAQKETLSVSIPWYRLFIALWQRGSPAPVQLPTITLSPYVYKATQTGTLTVANGTVELSRDDGAMWYACSSGTANATPMLGGDSARITYADPATVAVAFFPSQ